MVKKLDTLKSMWNGMFKSGQKKKKIAFTLAEATTVLVILGVIAAITVPSLINRQKDLADRAKLKKAWEIYDAAIQTMRADHPMMTKQAFTDWANQAGCPNTVEYFKTVDVDANNGCSFKTPDGIWLNISDILHPSITIDGNNNQNDENTFKFVVSYDSDNLKFSVNDINANNLTTEEKADLEKLFEELDMPIEKFCIGQWCFIDDKIVNIGSGEMCQYELHKNGWWTDCLLGEAREMCAVKEGTDSKTCSYCVTNPNSYACRRGGYYCAKIDATHMECHINGGMVSDIQYDKNGCVTWVQCNWWNAPCRNGGSTQAKKQCKTALCSYENGEWVTGGSDLDKEFFNSFVDDWVEKTGGDRSLCQ